MKFRLILFAIIALFNTFLMLNAENESNQIVTIRYLNGKSKISYDNGQTWKDISRVKIIRPNFTKTSEDAGSSWNYSYSNNTKEQENLDLKTNNNFTNISIYSSDFRLLSNESLNKEKIDFNKINILLKNLGRGMYIIVLTGENSNKVIKVQY